MVAGEDRGAGISFQDLTNPTADQDIWTGALTATSDFADRVGLSHRQRFAAGPLALFPGEVQI